MEDIPAVGEDNLVLDNSGYTVLVGEDNLVVGILAVGDSLAVEDILAVEDNLVVRILVVQLGNPEADLLLRGEVVVEQEVREN